MMRVLVSSNSHHTHTGYGTQSKGLIDTLLGLGHEVAIHAWYGLQGGIIQAGPVKMYPRLRHNYGNDAHVVADDFDADLVITLQDIWVLDETYAERMPCPWVAWFPVDGDPAPMPVVEQARRAAYPVVFSKFAYKLLQEAGVEHVRYIPHGIDTETFAPGDKTAVRQKHGIPEDKFMVTMVAANKGYPSRKSYPEAILAFKHFHKANPDSFLYLHTAQYPPGSGINLSDVIRLVGLPEEAYSFVNQRDYALGLPDSFLAEIYQASDVLLAPSMGEGFGLPIAEAQACGCPVITTDATSMSELTVNGTAVHPLQPFYTPLGHWQYVANVGGVIEALQEWRDMETAVRAYRAAQGIEHFRQGYSWDVVGPQGWKPFLEEVEATLSRKHDPKLHASRMRVKKEEQNLAPSRAPVKTKKKRVKGKKREVVIDGR
jgi:glycosyltransferase involved in cell wall biosynthesis